jgi:hypothetical protein
MPRINFVYNKHTKKYTRDWQCVGGRKVTQAQFSEREQSYPITDIGRPL